MLRRDLVDSIETVRPGRRKGVLFWRLERHFMDPLIFLISLLLIISLVLISLALCACKVTNYGRNGMRVLKGPPFHDVSCTVICLRDRTRSSDIPTDQVDTVMYPPSDPRYKFDEFVPGGIRKRYKYIPPS
jgi:hypothetical protein